MKVLLATDDTQGIVDRLYRLIGNIPNVEPMLTLIKVDEIIESVCSLSPNVLVMDLYLLDGTALNVLSEIRAMKNKPVLMILTEQPYEDIEAQLKVAGADYVLNKSLEFELIVKILNKLNVEQEDHKQKFTC